MISARHLILAFTILCVSSPTVSASEKGREVTYVWQKGNTLSHVLFQYGVGHNKGGPRLYGRRGWIARNIDRYQRKDWSEIPDGTRVKVWVPDFSETKVASPSAPSMPSSQLEPSSVKDDPKTLSAFSLSAKTLPREQSSTKRLEGSPAPEEGTAVPPPPTPEDVVRLKKEEALTKHQVPSSPISPSEEGREDSTRSVPTTGEETALVLDESSVQIPESGVGDTADPMFTSEHYDYIPYGLLGIITIGLYLRRQGRGGPKLKDMQKRELISRSFLSWLFFEGEQNDEHIALAEKLFMQESFADMLSDYEAQGFLVKDLHFLQLLDGKKVLNTPARDITIRPGSRQDEYFQKYLKRHPEILIRIVRCSRSPYFAQCCHELGNRYLVSPSSSVSEDEAGASVRFAGQS